MYARYLLLLFALVVQGSAVVAQPRIALQPESQVRIHGRSTVSAFACSSTQVQGDGHSKFTLHDALPESTAPATISGTARIQVPVASLDCGHRQMNRDLYEALKANTYPEIAFSFGSARLRTSTTRKTYHVQVAGLLTIAGTTRTVEMDVHIQPLADGRFQATARLPLDMRDYAIQPPTAMMGLIRVQPRIEVHFDLRAAQVMASTGATPSTH